MRAIALVGWLVIVAALLVWQGIGLVHGPEWPTLSDFFRSFMTVPLGRFLLFGLWLWLGWHRMKSDRGLYRWYNDYRLPEHLGGGQITVRLHQDKDDRVRKFNRTENVRPIPPSDPDFPRLYGRRNDSESLNRSLEDTLFLGRAHSLGWRRQQVEMLGWALMVNALTMARHRAAEGLEAAA